MKLPPKLAVVVGLAYIAVSHLGWAAGAPVVCYVAQNGIVYDGRTKLNWQQAVDAGNYTWDAGSYCQTLSLSGGGWRLPTWTELETIVDDSRYGPSIDPVAFPNTPTTDPRVSRTAYWTSSAVAGTGSYAWAVEFFYGFASPTAVASTLRVRCVR